MFSFERISCFSAIKTLVLAVALLLVVAPARAQDGKPLKNSDVIEMSKAGFSEETIIKAIEANATDFDTSVSSLLELKKAGISEKVINSMLVAKNRKAGGTEAAAAAPAPAEPIVAEVGVYVINQYGKPVEVLPEIVTWRTGGFLKGMATGGLVKPDMNGVVEKPHSPLQTGAPVEFIIRCAEGTSAAEYQLVKLREKDKRREFRIMTGGVIHSSGGAKRDNIEFKFDKIGPATYRIKLADLKAGEYGFLAPAAVMSASAASSGKIYTFAIE